MPTVWLLPHLSTPGEPITWTLPSTPGTPNWKINSDAYNQPNVTVPAVAVPFSAAFWRRAECPTQLILTLDLSGPIMYFGTWSAFQAGTSKTLGFMTVNDPAAYGGSAFQPSPNVLPLLSVELLQPVNISGVVDFSASSIDPSQAMTIDFTPTPFSSSGTVSVQIPAAASVTPPAFTIGNGMTGQWFDPNESGHGFGLEVLPGNVLLAEWYVFARRIGRDWIIASGPIVGNTAVLAAAQTSGGKFPPNFNPAQIENQAWGPMTFTFTDCNNGTASWQPTVAGYTAGSIPITRLTMPAGLTCP